MRVLQNESMTTAIAPVPNIGVDDWAYLGPLFELLNLKLITSELPFNVECVSKPAECSAAGFDITSYDVEPRGALRTERQCNQLYQCWDEGKA